MARKYSANHPISGQLFAFPDKAAADLYAAEVFAATGYRPQLFPVGPDPEPVATVADPAADGAPEGADLPLSAAAAVQEPQAPAGEPNGASADA